MVTWHMCIFTNLLIKRTLVKWWFPFFFFFDLLSFSLHSKFWVPVPVLSCRKHWLRSFLDVVPTFPFPDVPGPFSIFTALPCRPSAFSRLLGHNGLSLINSLCYLDLEICFGLKIYKVEVRFVLYRDPFYTWYHGLIR